MVLPLWTFRLRQNSLLFWKRILTCFPHIREGIVPGRNVVHPPLVIYLWKQSSQLHIKVQHKTMVDRSIVAWENVAAEKRSVDGAPRALSRHKGAIVVWLCFPMLWCLLSSLSFLPITQPPIRRPRSGPPIGFSGSRGSGWMSSSTKRVQWEMGPKMPCRGLPGWMMDE